MILVSSFLAFMGENEWWKIKGGLKCLQKSDFEHWRKAYNPFYGFACRFFGKIVPKTPCDGPKKENKTSPMVNIYIYLFLIQEINQIHQCKCHKKAMNKI